MPLIDHFHPPGMRQAPWSSLGMVWAVQTHRWLNRTLPRDRYQAFVSAHLGQEAEADIAEFEYDAGWSPAGEKNGDGGVATLAVPPATAAVEVIFPDEFAVEVRDVRNGMTLVGVVEFVSPSNKDRPEARGQFVAKCLAYLHHGVGVAVVDVVTSRLANLHNELAAALRLPAAGRMADVPTYVAGYRPHDASGRQIIDLWMFPAAVGSPVPAVPLALKNGPAVMVDLESTYLEALADYPPRPDPPRSAP